MKTRKDTLMVFLLTLVTVTAAWGQAAPLPKQTAKSSTVIQKVPYPFSQTTVTNTNDFVIIPLGPNMFGKEAIDAAVKEANKKTSQESIKEAQEEKEANVELANQAFTKGEAFFKLGKPKEAVASYTEALTYSPYDGLAYRRLAEAYAAGGQMTEASQSFHKVLVEGFGPGHGNSIGDPPDAWAEYALVLVKTNQTAEAVQAYNHAASLLDYEDSQHNGGKPSLKVLLPELVAERTLPEQVRYTPECLQALAETTLAHEEMSFGSNTEALAHMQEAVKLYPDSAVTNYYLGEALALTYYHGGSHLPEDLAGARAAFQKAIHLGDDATVVAAKERLAMYR